MISLTSPVVWLFVIGSGFFAIVLYWARVAVTSGPVPDSFIDTRSSVPSFTIAVLIGAASFVPFFAIGFAETVATEGYAFAALSIGTVMIPLAGVFVFKRVWAIAARYGCRTQASFFDDVLGNTPMAVLSAAVALLFAVALGGRIMSSFALQYYDLTGGTFDPVYSLFLIAGVIAALTVIGGMRGIAFAGTIQAALGLVVLIGLIIFTLYQAGGFEALISRVVALQGSEGTPESLFKVPGIIQFTLGAGVEGAAGGNWTAAMVLSTAVAFLGLHAAPVLYLFAVSSDGNGVFGPGLTWVTAALFGGVITVLLLLLGSIGLVNGQGTGFAAAVQALVALAPWFSALAYFGLLSLAFAFVAGSFLAGAQVSVVDIYRRYFHPAMSDDLTIVAIRILVLVLILLSVLASLSAPVVMAELAELCLPLSVQLLPGLIAATQRFGISRRSVPVGAFLGVGAVLLTESFGIRAFAFIGLDLPWGAAPWTIHSAGWGLGANCAAVAVISVIMRYRAPGEGWERLSVFRDQLFPRVRDSRRVVAAAWSVGLAWVFLAVGPGLVIGNGLFVKTVRRTEENLLGMPSLVIWILMAWFTGVALTWFLAYRMKLSSSEASAVAIAPSPASAVTGGMRTDRMAVAVWIVLGILAAITTLAWIFG